MERFVLFLKGFCMGIADVIPGVSGGTLALILGVYRELIDTIKSITPKPLFAAYRWLKNGRTGEDREQLINEMSKLNFGFLIPLVMGIVAAFGIGSIVIPRLMSDFPEATRAFFFGLILASVAAPFRMIKVDTPKTIVGVGIVLGAVFGYVVTNPAHQLSFANDSVIVESRGESLKELTRRGPSAKSAADVFWSADNAPLRDAVKQSNAALYQNLETMNAADPNLIDKDALKKRSEPYETIEVPPGTRVSVPRLAYWFVFVAGLIAICAMILPGISGSYILLILGAYFFMLNALKGFIETLAAGQLPVSQFWFVTIFCLGCGIGILSFARLLSYLLLRHGAITLSVLVGLMIGCLRGVWPFRVPAGNVVANVLPNASDGALIPSVVAGIIGFTIVAVFTYVGRQRGSVTN